MRSATFTAGSTCSTTCCAASRRTSPPRPPRKTYIVFLGDLVDRGPDSAGVVERLRTWRPRRGKPIFLGGNHEEVLLRILGGDAAILPDWLKFGGAECAESYGIDVDALRRMEDEEAIAAIRAGVPRAHREFLEHFADTFAFGDYLFVHAGIRPGIAHRGAGSPRICAGSATVPQRRQGARLRRRPRPHDRAARSTSGRTGSRSTPAPIDSGVLTALGIEEGSGGSSRHGLGCDAEFAETNLSRCKYTTFARPERSA